MRIFQQTTWCAWDSLIIMVTGPSQKNSQINYYTYIRQHCIWSLRSHFQAIISDPGTCSQYNIWGGSRIKSYVCYLMSILFKNTSVCKIESLEGNGARQMLTAAMSRVHLWAMLTFFFVLFCIFQTSHSNFMLLQQLKYPHPHPPKKVIKRQKKTNGCPFEKACSRCE